jgi:hypothetical protein
MEEIMKFFFVLQPNGHAQATMYVQCMITYAILGYQWKFLREILPYGNSKVRARTNQIKWKWRKTFIKMSKYRKGTIFPRLFNVTINFDSDFKASLGYTGRSCPKQIR